MEESKIQNLLSTATQAEVSQTGAELERARGGDRSAFDRLFRRFGLIVETHVAYVLRTLGPGLRAKIEAEDLAQDILVRAWEKLKLFEYRGQGSLRAWMCTMTERHLQNRIASWKSQGKDIEKERAASQQAGTGPGISLPAASGPGPVTMAHEAEQRALVVSALASLPQRPRELLERRYVMRESWDEIASALDFSSADAARMACHRSALSAFGTALRDAREKPGP